MFMMLVACNSVGAVAVLLCFQHELRVVLSSDWILQTTQMNIQPVCSEIWDLLSSQTV